MVHGAPRCMEVLEIIKQYLRTRAQSDLIFVYDSCRRKVYFSCDACARVAVPRLRNILVRKVIKEVQARYIPRTYTRRRRHETVRLDRHCSQQADGCICSTRKLIWKHVLRACGSRHST